MTLVLYPNRRIYDTEQHAYFPAVELRPRLMNGEKVECKETGDDATPRVLLGLIRGDLKDGHGPDADQLLSLMQGYTAKR